MEVVFEIGDRTETHGWPDGFSWIPRGEFIHIMDGDNRLVGAYQSARVICIRALPPLQSIAAQEAA